MSYLARLASPPGGTVLDPFCGSGSTGKACVREGLGFVGIELDAEYAEIARRRIAYEEEKHGTSSTNEYTPNGHTPNGHTPNGHRKNPAPECEPDSDRAQPPLNPDSPLTLF